MGFKKEVRFGGRELVDTLELLLPAGEAARVDLELGEDYTNHPTSSFVRLDVVFEETRDEPQSVQFRPSGKRSKMILKNWSNPVGTALSEPFSLVTTSKGVMEIMMANYAIGGTNHLTIQFWWNEEL